VTATRAGSLLFDPAAQPWQPAGEGLSALGPECLSTNFLHRTLNAASVRGQEIWLDADLRTSKRLGPLTQAAVLIALVGDVSEPSVILTRRAEHLSDHAGQISFPGGRQEHHDANAEAAALREAQEEIGLSADYVTVLGCLPVYPTVSGFAVTPVVAQIRPGFTLIPDSAEVADVFNVPLKFLLNPANHRLHQAVLPDGQVRHFYSITWREHFIWGATAAMLRQLYCCLRAAVDMAD